MILQTKCFELHRFLSSKWTDAAVNTSRLGEQPPPPASHDNRHLAPNRALQTLTLPFSSTSRSNGPAGFLGSQTRHSVREHWLTRRSRTRPLAAVFRQAPGVGSCTAKQDPRLRSACRVFTYLLSKSSERPRLASVGFQGCWHLVRCETAPLVMDACIEVSCAAKELRIDNGVLKHSDYAAEVVASTRAAAVLTCDAAHTHTRCVNKKTSTMRSNVLSSLS